MPHSPRKSSVRIAVSPSGTPETAKRHSSRDWGRRSHDVLFFALFYLYLWLYVNPRLIYHGAGVITNFPVFYRGGSFFLPFLSYPGGPVEYLAAFVSQLFYYSWLGAFAITVQAALMSLCIETIANAIHSTHVRGIRFLPPILLLVLYTQYTYFLETTLALLTVLLTTCLYVKAALSRTKNFKCVGVFLILSVMVYYLSGGAFLLFVVLCAMVELMFRARWTRSLFYCLSGVVIPYVLGRLIFGVSLIDAFSNLLPFSWKILNYDARKRAITIVYVLYLIPPLTLLIIGLWQMLRKRRYSRKKRNEKASGRKQRPVVFNLPTRVSVWFRRSPKLHHAAGLSLLLAVTGCAVFFSRNENLRTRFKVDYCAYHKKWLDLLTSAQRCPTDPFVAYTVNRALYHRGRLGYDMFSWPQHPDCLFLSDKKYEWTYWQIFDFYLDLGVVNMAEHALTESLEELGERPMILQRLALINMVKGNGDSANIYLSALSKTLYHADWANHYLNRLRTDPNLSSDSYIQHLRSLCLDKNYSVYALSKERTLLQLLEKNPRNRMAFEYLMAWYMLKKQLGKCVQKMEGIRDLGYAELPPHYEEAALIYIYATGKSLDLGDYRARPQKRQQIEDFTRILNRYGGNKQAASRELSEKFRNTYFFYYRYESSGPEK